MSASLKFKGIAPLMKKLKALDAVAGRKALGVAARYAMKPVETAARDLAPVDDGDLRNSIRLARVQPRRGNVVVSVGVTVSRRKVRWEIEDDEGGSVQFSRTADASFRWHFAEFGTRHHAAHPYLRPAFVRNRDVALRRLQERLARVIDRAIRKQEAQ